jgi:YegS/Rv2252/BmrU family lipid kinase
MRAKLIFNPASGRGKPKLEQLQGLTKQLESYGIEAEPAPTDGPGHATELAREAAGRQFDAVLVWGGDGTLNEVAAGLLEGATPLGLIPGGSVNVFARSTGIPLRSNEACAALARSQPRLIPIGMAASRPFLLMVGIGIDAEVVRQLDPAFKKKLGKLGFWLKGFAQLASYSYRPFIVRANNKEYQATSVIAGKLRFYGGRYLITPAARLEEPLLNVVLFQGRGSIAYLRYLVGVLGRFHLRFPDVVSLKTSHFDVDSSSPVYYQIDGELGGETPVTVGVRQDALKVLLPSHTKT